MLEQQKGSEREAVKMRRKDNIKPTSAIKKQYTVQKR